MDHQKFKIILYVTKGCASCSIMHNNINQVIDSLNDIELSILDKEHCWNEMLKIDNIKDFPTMIFFINDKTSFKLEGTYSVEYIQKCINNAIIQ